MSRVSAYIDGFNLYHSIDALRDNQIKWLNLVELCNQLSGQSSQVDHVHFFTAVLNWDPAKQKRHRNYINALQATGVLVHEGDFRRNKKKCWEMDRFCSVREEKQTDVSIAVQMVRDAYEDRFDRALLVTADTDQIPTVKLIEGKMGKPVILRFPPNRKAIARDLGNQVRDKREISVGLLRACLLPRNVFDANQNLVASRPALYDQPRSGA